jgi:Cu2+-containing amine oxidase
MMATSAEHGQMANTNKLNAYSRKPVSYRLVSREVPKLLPKENGIVWKRTCFERRAVHVTKCKVIPQLATCRSLTSDFGCRQSATSAGRHVPQSSGEPSKGIPEWIAANPTEKIDNTDIVLWHIFGITHFPAPEDYPIMPAELLYEECSFRRAPQQLHHTESKVEREIRLTRSTQGLLPIFVNSGVILVETRMSAVKFQRIL